MKSPSKPARLANLADGAVTVRYGDTIVIVTAVSATKIKEGQDFFPLTVDYREKARRRSARSPAATSSAKAAPREKEILTCRMTDRPLRPLFPKGYLYDTQIITTLLSADGENDPDILTINGASAALMVSDIPFAGPIGARPRRPRRTASSSSIPPTPQMELSDLDLVYVGHGNRDHHDRGRGASNCPRRIHQGRPRLRPGGSARSSSALQKDLAAKAGKPKRTAAPLRRASRAARDRLPGGRRPHRSRHLHPEQSRALRTPSARSRTRSPTAIMAKYPEATAVRHQSQAFD